MIIIIIIIIFLIITLGLELQWYYSDVCFVTFSVPSIFLASVLEAFLICNLNAVIETVKTAFFWSKYFILSFRSPGCDLRQNSNSVYNYSQICIYIARNLFVVFHFFLTKVTTWWPKARNKILWSEERRFHCFNYIYTWSRFIYI